MGHGGRLFCVGICGNELDVQQSLALGRFREGFPGSAQRVEERAENLNGYLFGQPARRRRRASGEDGRDDNLDQAAGCGDVRRTVPVVGYGLASGCAPVQADEGPALLEVEHVAVHGERGCQLRLFEMQRAGVLHFAQEVVTGCGARHDDRVASALRFVEREPRVAHGDVGQLIGEVHGVERAAGDIERDQIVVVELLGPQLSP